MSIQKKIVIKELEVDPKMRYRTIYCEEGKRVIKANLSKQQIDFFHTKWIKKTKCYSIESFVYFLQLYGVNGVRADIPISRLPTGNIRSVKAVSNSALSRLKEKLLGATPVPMGRKGVFGNCFHELVLEPHTYSLEKYNLRPSEITRLHAMKKAIDNDSLTQKLLSVKGNIIESSRIWIDPITGLKCKGKLDIDIVKYSEVVDLKTTAVMSQKEYEEAMNSYDYDRQVAFYGKGAKAKRVRFIGVQKVEPYNVYHYCFDMSSDFVKRGEKKMNHLLKKYKEQKT